MRQTAIPGTLAYAFLASEEVPHRLCCRDTDDARIKRIRSWYPCKNMMSDRLLRGGCERRRVLEDITDRVRIVVGMES